ncbi:MAG: type 4a pilus biogenesis protein PilO [Candidatus Omnitrophica bacterium]|nr:type 4a pilus biogenesis protein PilO [Candidatus Omnitrophota bacterium]
MKTKTNMADRPKILAVLLMSWVGSVFFAGQSWAHFKSIVRMQAEMGDLRLETAMIKALAQDEGERTGQTPLLAAADISSAINDLTTLGRRWDIQFTSIDVQKIEKVRAAELTRQPVVLNFESRYKALGEFLEAVRKYDQGMVDVGSLRALRTDDNSQRIQCSVTVHIYLESAADG